ncbi:transporter substrate-binding domain-containing protein [Chlorobaculum thiosulfatiphilum]|uniref:Transporter substrate-binding domain-containing protein n=1 Tax=Chlorobaculum thiosulfatiphilum TaxID=115852 RepID=A0A5C4S3X2_CHLTI|nr:transporter substrate-binding domain-containing protein [Chlorobaculum thiosulfatiphilum]TNJ38193.1 transporter substrate-binding domain-containing protein [Chlorobaculum thiosulfatiphilum]
MKAQSGKQAMAGRFSGKRWPALYLITASVFAFIAADWLLWQCVGGPPRDLADIRRSGRLRVLLSYDPIDYFIYRGEPMGYSYELARSFTRYLGVPLEVVVVKDMNNQIPVLRSKKSDIVAHLTTITPESESMVRFSNPLESTRQVLVQRRPKGGDVSKLVRRLDQLDGKTVYVHQNSAFYSTLTGIMETKKISINIVPVEGSLSTSELIGKVSDGTFDYTAANENIASTHTALFSNIDIRTSLSARLPLAWAVRKNSPELLDALNRWLEKSRKNGELAIIRDKYYNSLYRFKKHATRAFYSNQAGTISPYDALVKKQARNIDWDWRLLAALVYEESQFDAGAVSWAGAIGLMQLMPATGAYFKARDLFDPVQNLRAGAEHIKFVDREWREIEDRSMRLKFVLASYNVGAGHVRDAQKLASKYGAKPNVWEGNVEKYLALKSERRYYNDPVTTYGYCNGPIAVRYTRNILDRYRLYREVIPK